MKNTTKCYPHNTGNRNSQGLIPAGKVLVDQAVLDEAKQNKFIARQWRQYKAIRKMTGHDSYSNPAASAGSASTKLWTTRSRRSMTTRRIRRQSSAGGWTNITGEKRRRRLKKQVPKNTENARNINTSRAFWHTNRAKIDLQSDPPA